MNNKNAPKVCVIVLNYNGVILTYKGKSILESVLESIKKQRYSNYKLIVIDNGSTDSSKETIKQFNADIIDIKGGIYNFSAVNNIAIKYALTQYAPDYLLLMNNDITLIQNKFISRLVDTAQKFNAGIVSSEIFNPSRNGYKLQERSKYGANGSLFLISKESLYHLGLLDENFVMGGEDVDYFIRARDTGINMATNAKASALHLGSFTLNEDKNRAILSEEEKRRRFYYWKRNDIYFIRKHIGEYGLLSLLNELFLYFSSLSFGRNKETGRIEKKRPLSYALIAIKSIISALKLQYPDTNLNLKIGHNNKIRYIKYI